MKVYHGSDTQIEEIDLEKCKYRKDFGRGFYVTKLKEEDYTDEWFDFVIFNRRNKKREQVHDYDIVEGPVANDKIATQIDDYLEGTITKEQFFNDLIYTPSHQICFCTVQSLHVLSLAKGKIDSAIYHIDSDILQALMTDYGMNELEATDKYYTSQTYIQLADETTEFYKKSWQEIYQMLQQELKLS